MAKFKVGDRVVLASMESGDFRSPMHVGMTGTVADVYTNCRHGICFDEYFDGHTCNGNCEDGHGWYGDSKNLKLLVEEPKEEPAGFKVGDRVVAVKDYGLDAVKKGMTGTVKKARDEDGVSIGVSWDGFRMGHDLHGLLAGEEKESGYYVPYNFIKLISDSKPATPKKPKAPAKEEQPKKDTCRKCSKFEPIHGQNGFCKSWHNFCTDVESCSRYSPKTEPDQPVDNSL